MIDKLKKDLAAKRYTLLTVPEDFIKYKYREIRYRESVNSIEIYPQINDFEIVFNFLDSKNYRVRLMFAEVADTSIPIEHFQKYIRISK